MKNCPDRAELLSEMIFGAVPEGEAFEAHEHLADCEGCMNFYISLYETLADTDGEELVKGLSIAQKAQIFATAKQIDQQKEEKKVKKFRWATPLSIAAAVTISGIIILPEFLSSKGNLSVAKMSEHKARGVQPHAVSQFALEEGKSVHIPVEIPSPKSATKKSADVDRDKSEANYEFENIDDSAPSTDDDMLDHTVADIVVAPSALASRSATGGVRFKSDSPSKPVETEELDVLEDSEEEQEFASFEKEGEERRKGQNFDKTRSAEKNKILNGTIIELNDENDDLKNEIGINKANNTRISKQLAELKEVSGGGRGRELKHKGELVVNGEIAKLYEEPLENIVIPVTENEKDRNKDGFITYQNGHVAADGKFDDEDAFGRDDGESDKKPGMVDLYYIKEITKATKKDNFKSQLTFGFGASFIEGKKFNEVKEGSAKDRENLLTDTTLVGRSKELSKEGRLIESKTLLERVLVNEPYNEAAVNELQKINKTLFTSGKLRRQAMVQERIDEIEWKWSDPTDSYLTESVIKKGEKFKADKLGEKVLEELDSSDTSRIEEALKQQKELVADNGLLQAQKKIREGDYLEAEEDLKKVIGDYSQLAKEPRIIEKLKNAEKKLAVLKEKLKPKTETRRQMIATATVPQSTFSIDVDTASYQMAKSIILKGGRPDPMSVRAEEFINYFKYNYEAPKKDAFKVHTELTASPFHRGSHIMKIGVQGRRPGGDHRSASHFCFIVDTSGSMAADGRLPLVKKVLPMIAKQMSAGDKVSLISCGLKARLELDYVDIANLDKIYERIEALNAVGATNLEASIVGGYNHVLNHIKPGTYNRVILLSDGVANVGEANANKILAKLDTARQKGVGITVIGMGENEYNDNFLETMADKGDGNYLFIDGGKEAQKAFEENFAATFHTIAYNVKIQVEFDPRQVASYRLLGYENRRLKNKDFRNDKVDAGEVGSGQSVTAIYELAMTGNRKLEPLAEVRLRYRDAVDNKMKEFATPVKVGQAAQSFEKASKATKLALLIGKFAEVLRDGGNSEGITVNDLLKHLRPLNSEFNDSDVAVLLRLLEKTK